MVSKILMKMLIIKMCLSIMAFDSYCDDDDNVSFEYGVLWTGYQSL